jgi:hypothetical protein
MTTEHSSQYQGTSIDLVDLISLTVASQLSGLSTSHLRLLVSKGELWGTKIGRNWLTSKQAVLQYIGIGHKPGRKPNPEN